MTIRTVETQTTKKVNFINVEFVNEDCNYFHLILTTARDNIFKEEFPAAHVIIEQLLKLYEIES